MYFAIYKDHLVIIPVVFKQKSYAPFLENGRICTTSDEASLS